MGLDRQPQLRLLDLRRHGNGRAPGLLRRPRSRDPLRDPPRIHRRPGRDDGHLRHPAPVLEPPPIAHPDLHRRPVRPLWLQRDDLRLDGHQVTRLPGDGVVSQLLGLLRRRHAAGHRHRDLQARRSGHAHQSHQPPQQLDGLGHLLPDRQHRRLDRPAHRPPNAAPVLEIRLLHQRRCHLLQLPPPAHLSRAGQGGAPRPPATPARRQGEAAQPRPRGPGRAEEASPRPLPHHLLRLVAHVPHALGRPAQVHRGLGGHRADGAVPLRRRRRA